MGIFQNHLMAGAAAAASAGGASFYDHQIEQSIRLDRSTTSDGGANGSFLQRASSAIPTALYGVIVSFCFIFYLSFINCLNGVLLNCFYYICSFPVCIF